MDDDERQPTDTARGLLSFAVLMGFIAGFLLASMVMRVQ